MADVDAANLSPQHLLAEIFDRNPELGKALDKARGPCKRFQGTVLGHDRKCRKGNECLFLHVPLGQALALARNRLQTPFLQLTGDNKLLLIPL